MSTMQDDSIFSDVRAGRVTAMAEVINKTATYFMATAREHELTHREATLAAVGTVEGITRQLEQDAASVAVTMTTLSRELRRLAVLYAALAEV